MGKYIDYIKFEGKFIALEPQRKAEKLILHANAILCDKPDSIASVPEDKAIVCVVKNAFFDAAAFVYDEAQLRAFTRPNDYRVKTWLTMGKGDVQQLLDIN